MVTNSHGEATSGNGIFANRVLNSFGKSGSGTGAMGIAAGDFGSVQNSFGQSSGTSSIGIQARTVSFSVGLGTSIGIQGLNTTVGSLGLGSISITPLQFLPP
jgi:hypothetical protein